LEIEKHDRRRHRQITKSRNESPNHQIAKSPNLEIIGCEHPPHHLAIIMTVPFIA
jgi:hypothetical protein